MTLGDNIPTWNVVCGLAIAAIVGCAVFDRVAPRPKIGDTVKKQAAEQTKLTAEWNQAKADLKKAEDSIAKYAWASNVSDVGPAVLDKVNRAAAARSVKISTFRPQRVQDVAPLKAAEYTVSVQGSFLAVVAFVKDLENPESKLVVTSAQFSSTDAATSAVSASVGLVAFVNEPLPAKKKPEVNNGKA